MLFWCCIFILLSGMLLFKCLGCVVLVRCICVVFCYSRVFFCYYLVCDWLLLFFYLPRRFSVFVWWISCFFLVLVLLIGLCSLFVFLLFFCVSFCVLVLLVLYFLFFSFLLFLRPSISTLVPIATRFSSSRASLVVPWFVFCRLLLCGHPWLSVL